jgi:hypothetical protein
VGVESPLSRLAEKLGAALVATDRVAWAASRRAMVWAIHAEVELAGVAVLVPGRPLSPR